MRMKRFFLWIGLAFLLSMGVNSVWAHDEFVDYPSAFELGDYDTLTHYEDVNSSQSERKGIFSLTITNTGQAAWGDFHFYLDDTSTVIFRVEGDYPSMDGIGAYNVNVTDFILDFEFYADPVYHNDSVTFNVYTDNTASGFDFFNMGIEATPVPIPAAVWLFGSGLIGLVGLLRKT